MLNCVVYTLIENYSCVEYLPCQSKILISTSWNPTFKDKSFNVLLGIGIPELLLNLVSFHGFMKKPNLTVILNLPTRLINNYLFKGLAIIEQNTKQLNLLSNYVKLIINVINQLDTDHVMVKNKAISSVANTILKMYIQKICI